MRIFCLLLHRLTQQYTKQMPLNVNFRNWTGEKRRLQTCVTSVTIILFEISFRLVSLAAVFSIVTQRYDTKNGCEGD